MYDFPLTIEWRSGRICFLDQTLLPERELMLEISSLEALIEAIKMLRIRGAPAIGVAAAFGIALSGLLHINLPSEEYQKAVLKDAALLAAARPTAVNLTWAVEKMKKTLSAGKTLSNQEISAALLEKAHNIQIEDLEIGMALGRTGSKIIKNNDVIITHCNAGGLATAGMGSALASLYYAHKDQKKFRVYADETRPLLQGSRLTVYELMKWGIDVTLICDNMAGMLMKRKIITMAITGADRIAADGDAANKTGTYSLAVLAKYHNIPFYIAAPYSTFDLTTVSGNDIPIEERRAEEITQFNGRILAPPQTRVYNPAFDVVAHELITAFITEKGLIYPPFRENIKKAFS